MQVGLTALVNQRRQLKEVIHQLRSARSQCMQYRFIALHMYQGDEATYILEAINQVNQQLFNMMNQCSALDEQYAWMQRIRYGYSTY